MTVVEYGWISIQNLASLLLKLSKKAMNYVAISVFFIGLASCLVVKGELPLGRRPILMAPSPILGARAPVAGTIEQRVDHDMATDTRTWQQRYFINEQFYEIGGPIFVMMSIEGAANPDFLRGGQMMELALLYKAKAFLLEERFYGQSRPTLDTSDDNLRYASPAQNVGDLAAFIRAIKISHPGAKLIAFGGSFGGSFVTWAKQKYPEIIDGAVVSSASLLATFGFPEYLEEVTAVMKLADEACVTDMEEAINAVEDILFGGETGGDTIGEMFNLCAPLDTTKPLDVLSFFQIFSDIYSSVVEGASSLVPVQDYCDLITNPLYGSTPLDRLTELITSVFHPSGCVEVRFDPFIPFYQNATWENPFFARRTHLYQRCAFNADFVTSDSANQPFGNYYPMDRFVDICMLIYPESNFDANVIQNAVAESNSMFGGQSPNVSNTVFVHGSFDPWRLLGVTADLSETVTAIFIEGTSHITDMGSASVSDSEELKAARTQIRDLVGQWIS